MSQSFNPGILIQVAKELEDLHLFWIEDAVSLDNLDAFAYMSRSIGIPIATGERLRTLTDFDRLLTQAHIDYILPDVKHVGGITGLKKIATLAAARNIMITPHNPSGPVATAASVQCMASVPNFAILEYAWGEVDWRASLIDPPEEIVDGFIEVPSRPGLGITFKTYQESKMVLRNPDRHITKFIPLCLFLLVLIFAGCLGNLQTMQTATDTPTTTTEAEEPSRPLAELQLSTPKTTTL